MVGSVFIHEIAIHSLGLGLDIDELISRAPPRRRGGVDQWGARQASTFKVAGRHVLNVWRIMRGELSLNMYSFENVVFNVLRRRYALYHVVFVTVLTRHQGPTVFTSDTYVLV